MGRKTGLQRLNYSRISSISLDAVLTMMLTTYGSVDPVEGRRQPRLTVELVPATAWGANLRAVLSRSDWDNLRRKVAMLAGNLCEICGRRGLRHAVECHEVWDYNDKTHVQRLVRLIALCPACHQVKHFGATSMRGQTRAALAHLAKVNHWSYRDAEDHVACALDVWRRRSAHEWTLDLASLRAYGIEPPSTTHRVDRPPKS